MHRGFEKAKSSKSHASQLTLQVNEIFSLEIFRVKGVHFTFLSLIMILCLVFESISVQLFGMVSSVNSYFQTFSTFVFFMAMFMLFLPIVGHFSTIVVLCCALQNHWYTNFKCNFFKSEAIKCKYCKGQGGEERAITPGA